MVRPIALGLEATTETLASEELSSRPPLSPPLSCEDISVSLGQGGTDKTPGPKDVLEHSEPLLEDPGTMTCISGADVFSCWRTHPELGRHESGPTLIERFLWITDTPTDVSCFC